MMIEDKTDEIGMIALQGPHARKVLEKILLEDTNFPIHGEIA